MFKVGLRIIQRYVVVKFQYFHPLSLSLFLSVTLGRLPCRHWARPFSPFLLLSNLKRGGDLEKMSSNYIHKVKHFFEPQSYYNKHATMGNILTFYQSRTLV